LIGYHETIAVCGIVFFAATVRSTFGFGGALISMPLLSFVLPVRTVAPLVALVMLMNGLGILVRERRHISLRGTLRLVIPAFVSIPLGVWLLRIGNDRAIRGLLGIVILIFSVWSLRREHRQVLSDERWAPLTGLIAGFLGGAYNIAGPPVVMYGSMRHWQPERFRGMLQSFFTVTGVWIITVHAFQGLITREVLICFAVSLPSIFLAWFAGCFLSRRIPAQRFKVIVHCMLLTISVLLLWHALIMH
jgi:uncharacterized membrane protein YfcA